MPTLSHIHALSSARVTDRACANEPMVFKKRFLRVLIPRSELKRSGITEHEKCTCRKNGHVAVIAPQQSVPQPIVNRLQDLLVVLGRNPACMHTLKTGPSTSVVHNSDANTALTCIGLTCYVLATTSAFPYSAVLSCYHLCAVTFLWHRDSCILPAWLSTQHHQHSAAVLRP